MHSKMITAVASLIPTIVFGVPVDTPPLPVSCTQPNPSTPIPNPNDCNAALGNINPKKSYVCGATFTKGSCTVSYNQCDVDAPDVDGDAFKSAALVAVQSIVAACKSHSGVYVNKDGKHYEVDSAFD